MRDGEVRIGHTLAATVPRAIKQNLKQSPGREAGHVRHLHNVVEELDCILDRGANDDLFRKCHGAVGQVAVQTRPCHLILPLKLAPHLPKLGVAAQRGLDVAAGRQRARDTNEYNLLHDVHVNVGKVDGNRSQIGRRQAPAPCGREVVRDRAIDDACFRRGDLDTLAQGGALVGGQGERLQALDEAQVADSGEVEADVSQGV